MSLEREDPVKLELYGAGLDACRAFLEDNYLPLPEYIPGRAPHALNKWQNIGLCLGSRIWVDISLTSKPSMFKGRQWSYPAYKVDRTATGVLAHETGHYIAWLIECFSMTDGKGNKIDTRWVQERFSIAVKQEAQVSGYMPHIVDEAFAEAMRLYILNPDLLAIARPQRYYLIRHELGLYHIEGSWRDVLKDAPVHIRQASANFAKESL